MATATKESTKSRARGGSLSAWICGGLVFAAVVGWLPNPLERFFEEDAGTYRAVARVLEVSHSGHLRFVVQEALNKDGRLTQSNMHRIWPIYEAAMPTTNGFTLQVSGDADLATERAHLIAMVDAHPAAR